MLAVAPGEPFPAARVEAIRMGTTVATNALLERNGARTLFVTTQGFADSLRIGDQSRPDLFALNIVRPPPLYDGVVEADERLDAAGGVVRPLDRDALRRKLADARTAGFEAIAIAFLHADLAPAHEREAGEVARSLGFPFVALSHEVSPLPKFIPRAETTVADALSDTSAAGLCPPESRRRSRARRSDFMTSAGGLVSAAAFRGKDAVVSRPAGGVVLASRAHRRPGDATAVLGFDMGGTSPDVCRFAGRLARRDTARIAGVRLRSPMLDVETVAAGGGSILSFDGLRARAGPTPAPAPILRPAAYGRGGPAWTCHRRQPRAGPPRPARLPDRCSARPATSRWMWPAAYAASGRPCLSYGREASPEAAAEGFVAVAVEQMAQAVRRISTERGFDPREHALTAFGGAAGQVACQVAQALGVGEILCPRYASVLSAWGIGQAQIRARYGKPAWRRRSTRTASPAPERRCWRRWPTPPSPPSPNRGRMLARRAARFACATTARTPSCRWN